MNQIILNIRNILNIKSNTSNIITMIAIKGISMAISFLYVPLLLHALNTDAYAIWLTLTSIVSWVVMFDVGIGNGLRNKLSEALAKKELKEAKSYISTAYIAIFTIGLSIAVIFLISAKFINWQSILNARGFAKSTINELVIIVGLSFIFHFILGLINSVLLALKKPAISSIFGCIGQIVSYLVVLTLVKFFKIHNLLILCSIISIIPVINLICASLIIYYGKYNYLKPNAKYYDKGKLKSIFSLGLNFFWLQIITIILFQLNNIIITHTVGPDAVVDFNVCYKYLYLPVTIYTIICIPFWSASTQEYTVGNYSWINRIHKKLILTAIIFTILTLILAIFAPIAYKIWIGSGLNKIPSSTNYLMLAYSCLNMFYAASGYIINGIGKLRIQTIITTLLAIIYIPSAILGGKYIGLNGVLLALVFNAFVNSIWSYIQLRKILTGNASGIWIR